MDFINDTDYLDQHFLVDKKVINSFIDAANLKITDNVVEIGPGKGVLTSIIVKKVNHLACIEIDLKLEHFLNVLEEKYDNLDIIYGNVLDSYIPECDKIVAALPYSITEPFIEKLLCCNFKEAVLIVGKKYADSVLNNNINKLSMLTNCFFEVEKIMDIVPDSFEPKPRVMSSLITLKRTSRKKLLNNKKMFIFRELFFYRKRIIKNSIMEALIEYDKMFDKKLTKKSSKEIVDSFNIDKTIMNKQIENLSNDEIKIIYESII